MLGRQNVQNMWRYITLRNKAKCEAKEKYGRTKRSEPCPVYVFWRDFLREELLTETYLWSEQNETSKAGKLYSQNYRAIRKNQTVSKGLFTWMWETPGRWGNPPNRGRKIARISDTILQIRDAGGKFLDIVMALVILTKEFKMSLWRRMVKRYRNNIIYFLLRFSPVARCVNGFWRYNVFTSA